MEKESHKKFKDWIKISYILNLVFLGYFMYLIILSIKTDNNDFNRESLFYGIGKKDSNVLNNLVSNDSLTLANFPYKEYLKKTDLNDPDIIASDLLLLKNITNNNFLANNIIVKTLTAELYPYIWSNDLDSINQIIKWVEQLNFKDRSVNESISLYWYNNIASYLSKLAKESQNVKYCFKYRYLKQRCTQKDFFVDTGNSNFEKIILNTIDKQWNYLFNRFWLSTSWMFKIILFLVITSVSILFILGIKYLLILIKTKIDNHV